MYRNVGRLIAVLLFLFFAGGVAQDLLANDNVPAHTVVVTDARGRSVHVPLPVARLVLLNSDALEVVSALGAMNMVAGVPQTVAEDPFWKNRVGEMQAVGRWNEPNYEVIATLSPSAVIAYAHQPGDELERKMASFGITVVRLDFYRISTLKREVETLGRILEREEAASRLVEWYRRAELSIVERVRDCPVRPSVYIESYSDYHTAGPGSGAHEMCILAGGRNIAENFTIPYSEITGEWVLSQQPDVIVKAANIIGGKLSDTSRRLSELRNRITQRPAWERLRAVRQDRVYVMANDIWTGPRAIIGVAHMAAWMYPERFRGNDPEELHRRYCKDFQGVIYEGCCVYPIPGGVR
ncbi:MAG: ABC transporter substrate-binding protein [Syntrophales bacterium]|jgi:iron complex transport system substrate-binding protein|nr:ABC transporter substrate-binding protein [Syntrophales bacterium]MDY0043718.1 ABC transporter substrate-binding protein [Syntrophales bacterium]